MLPKLKILNPNGYSRSPEAKALPGLLQLAGASARPGQRMETNKKTQKKLITGTMPVLQEAKDLVVPLPPNHLALWPAQFKMQRPSQKIRKQEVKMIWNAGRRWGMRWIEPHSGADSQKGGGLIDHCTYYI